MAEHDKRGASVGPFAKREHLLEGVAAQHQRVHARHEMHIPAILPGGNEGVGFVQPVDAAICASDEAIQAGGNKYTALIHEVVRLTGAGSAQACFFYKPRNHPDHPTFYRIWLQAWAHR